jgi:small subunit ribosomal protein S11
MLIRQSLHRIPSSTSKRTCCKTTRHYTSRPPIPPILEENAESEPIPSTWPLRPSTPPSPPPKPSSSPLLNLIPILTDKTSSRRPRQSKDISAFLPQTIKAFYPQEEGILLAARPNPSLDRTPRTANTLEEPFQFLKHAYHIHINNSTRNTHITITNHKHDPIVVLSAGRLGLKHSKRGTHEAGAATAHEALKRFATKFPDVMDEAKIELVLKGFGPGRQGALSTIFGPMGEGVRGRINRVTDATTLAIGGARAPNRRRR